MSETRSIWIKLLNRPVVSCYAVLLLLLTMGAALPWEATAHICIIAWTFLAMPSSILLTVPFMGVNVLIANQGFGEDSAVFTVTGLAFHALAGALNVLLAIAVRRVMVRARRRTA